MPKPTISLLDVAKYYAELPHQNEALAYLDANVPGEVLSEFAKLWRAKPAEKSFEARIAERLSQLKISLDKGITLIGLEGCGTDRKANSDSFFDDAYNDLLLLVETKEPGTSFKILGQYQCTTEPGLFWTRSANRHKDGTARLQIDMKHADCWQIGSHKSQTPALVQTGAKVLLCRDLNADGSRNGDKLYEAWAGINCHHGDGTGKIGPWSAGCVVVDKPSEFFGMMKLLIDKAKPSGQSKFSFVLLDFSKI